MAYLRPLTIIALCAALGCRGDQPGHDSSDTDDPSGSSGSSGSEPTGTTDPEPTGTTGDGDWTRICDGSDALRLALVLGGGGTVENEIERAIGFRYLYVLGTCEYYALPTLDGVQWPDAHTGVIDLDTEEALSRALTYGDLAEIAGLWGTDGLADASTLLVSDGVHTVACYGGCELGPLAAQALWREMGWITTLWEKGEPLLGSLRVSVVGFPGEAGSLPSAPWPLMVDPWSIATMATPTSDFPTVRIDEGPELATLRELRRQYREDDLPADTPNSLYSHGHLLFHDLGEVDLFKLWIRDVLPIEDDDGHIPLPAP